MTFVLSERLLEVIDDELDSVSTRISDLGLSILSHDTELPASYRDNIVLIVHTQNGTLTQCPGGCPPGGSMPDTSTLDLSDPEPQTVLSEEPHGPSWRVLNHTLVDPTHGSVLAYASIALDMNQLDATLSSFATRVVIVDLFIIAFGGLLAWGLVRQSMRPLREIERTAGAIAAGDLSQRVPEGSLETETGSLAASLNVMLSRIEQSFETQRKSEERMRRFVSDASHELRTPLATVRGYGELYRLGGIPEDELPNAIGRIESEAQRMSGLVADLLQLARLDEGHPMRHTHVDLTKIAEDTVADMKAIDSERPTTLVGLDSASPARVVAVADEDRVRQVLSNLMGNAVQHTPPGTPIEIAVGVSDEHAVIEVRDHGQGVPSEHLPRIFGRFHRVDTSRSRASGGTGLGLAIVAAIVQAHHGTVRAIDTPGGGLTIHVALPMGPDGVPNGSAPRSVSPSTPRSAE